MKMFLIKSKIKKIVISIVVIDSLIHFRYIFNPCNKNLNVIIINKTPTSRKFIYVMNFNWVRIVRPKGGGRGLTAEIYFNDKF